ncbi:MAG: type VI secretion system tip protein VgrG [Methylococcales bacterium]|nr:type VI secretion system tip protein VgrG [Methylococcales bacterium]
MSSQDKRFVSVTTPLGPDILLFSRMSGYEELSRLFEYEVDLLVDKNNMALVTSGFPTNKVLGQAMIIAVDLPAGGKRYFHGLVTQFRHHGVADDFFLFRAVLRPWFWFLTRRSNCRIFQETSVPDIIKKVLADSGFSDFKLELSQTYQPRNYCVQYRESDFNFVSRLMEYEGIFYYFKHEQAKHTLIIADSVNAYQTIAGYETIPFFPPENTGQRKRDHIHEWHTAHEVQSGRYVLNDYDFEKPNSNLVTKFTEKKPHSHAEGEQYDYPGNYLEPPIGDTYANIRLDELQTDFEVMQGRGDAMGLTTGMLFTLKEHYITPENTKHIITSVKFSIVSNEYRSTSPEETRYDCDFKVIKATQQFRPQRLTPVPFVQGPQTATVVGKAGEEIWTDKYGRVKVQFHWEREGKKNETSSCWIRVATPIAGKKWGWVSLPRIDQEVVVSFLEGNPDRPLITGSVYNANQMPPYALPANQTQSGLKSHSSKNGDANNFNELRFEDKKDAEEVYIHAEKDFNCVIENNETRKIGLDKKSPGNQTVEIQNHRTITLNDGNETLTVKKGNRLTDVDTGNDTKNIKMGNHLLKISTGKSTIEAMQSIELKVGSNSIKIDQMGITVKGIMVKIEAKALLEEKGLMTKVEADTMLIIKGGITMIN